MTVTSYEAHLQRHSLCYEIDLGLLLLFYACNDVMRTGGMCLLGFDFNGGLLIAFSFSFDNKSQSLPLFHQFHLYSIIFHLLLFCLFGHQI